jgi:glutathione S-transferase
MATTLVMGNKNYSSWSIRPWFFIRAADLPIEDRVVPFDEPGSSEELARVSPSRRVPVLVLTGGEVIWDSLAIGEHLHETWPDKGVWPSDARLRRLARSACAEMHSGFSELRRVLTCNVRAAYAPEAWRMIAGGKDAELAVEADVARVHELWGTLLDASGGPFLCGQLGYVDAFFAPVGSRLATYGIESPSPSSSYRNKMMELPTYRLLIEQARAEKWLVARYEYAIEKREP